MIDLDIDRLFADEDYPGLWISVRLGAVERHLGLLTEFVPHIQDQTLIRFKADIERNSSQLSGEDLSVEIEGVKSVIENLIPISFYGSLVIVLYSAVESAITDVAQYVRKRESARLALSDLREPNTLKRLSLYLETLMKQPLRVPPEVTETVQQLQLVRNVLAHANGSLRDQREERRVALLRLAEAKVGILVEDNALVVTTAFLHRGFSASEALVTSLLAQVAEKYPSA
jgi:hypothetical protein